MPWLVTRYANQIAVTWKESLGKLDGDLLLLTPYQNFLRIAETAIGITFLLMNLNGGALFTE